ncbi:hypothetical protein BKA93DRAFT_611574 [Sparassis latifolia]
MVLSILMAFYFNIMALQVPRLFCDERTNGMTMDVSVSSYPDLNFSLKGGFNNFGIVTKFTMKSWPQTEIWGGVIEIHGSLYAQEFKAATANFSANVTDPKASRC